MKHKGADLEGDALVVQELMELKQVAPRDEELAQAGKARFMAEAEELSRQAVSPEEETRHSGWITKLIPLFRPRKEKPAMNLVASLIIIVSMILGTGGLTVAAAQSSLPNDLLYPVKVWSEDMRLDLAPDAQTRMQLEMEFSERRVAEAQAMIQNGQIPPESVPLRLQTHLQTALRAAMQQANERALQSLAEIQARVENQLRQMEQLQTNQPDNAIAEQIRQTLREQLRLAELGIEDPEQLRLMQQERDRINQPDEAPMQGNGPGPQPTPEDGYGPGPQPTPENGYSPGPQPTPENGYGPGPQPTPEDGYGPGPQPTPEDGYGPGPQPTPDNGYGPGPQPTPQQGSGKP